MVSIRILGVWALQSEIFRKKKGQNIDIPDWTSVVRLTMYNSQFLHLASFGWER